MKKHLIILGTLLVGFDFNFIQAKPAHAIAAAHGAAHATAHPVYAHPTVSTEATHTTTDHATTEDTGDEHTTTETTDDDHLVTVSRSDDSSSTTTSYFPHAWLYCILHPGKHHHDEYLRGYDDGCKAALTDKGKDFHSHAKPHKKVTRAYYEGYVHGYKNSLK